MLNYPVRISIERMILKNTLILMLDEVIVVIDNEKFVMI